MPTLNMQGPYEFSGAEIDKQITKTQAGNYAIGKIDPKGVFHVHYVGRSDMDVNNRLKNHLPKRYTKGYTHFKFSYASSPKDAFEKECQNYHDFGASIRLDNEVHPDLPDNSKNWKCPVCG